MSAVPPRLGKTTEELRKSLEYDAAATVKQDVRWRDRYGRARAPVLCLHNDYVTASQAAMDTQAA
ncbi:hypothetical protein GCM10027287_17880 [Bordetella muralis]